jgi:hypothetical protein
MEIVPETRVIRVNEFDELELGDLLVLVRRFDGTYFTMNPVAASIWGMIAQESTTFESIFSELNQKFEVDSDTLTKDLKDLLVELEQEGFVRIE